MKTALSFLFILFVAPIFAQNPQLESIIKREMQERRIPGLQIAVVQRGQIVLSKSYGIANLQYAIPVTSKSIFQINSCTKAFTGVAIMQLVEEGKIDLEAPVSRYLDSLPQAWQPVKVRQLLTHVSGLPDILRVLETSPPNLSEEAAWAKTTIAPMSFTTGTQFSYNQTNYALLGKIIDKYRQKPFAEVFKELQFQAAGMPNTGFGDYRDVIPNMTQSYKYVSSLNGQKLKEEKIINFNAEFPPFRRTASGMNSTAEDIAKWIIALQKGNLLKTKTAIKTLWTAGTYNNGKPTQWALGWMTKPRAKHSAVVATGGGRSAFFVYPEDDLTIVVLTNLSGASPEDFIDELAGCFNPEIPASDPLTALHIQLRKQGFDQAIAIVKEQKAKGGIPPSEPDLNDWAYRLLSKGRLTEALPLFHLNVYLYPDSWNVYDSYGEALMKNGQKEEAIRMYKKSLELNSQNEYGKKALEALMK
ncbi:serine hydrolase [Runella sp. MFBS21]|uniref:serine hydrolase n=1 Tax=Runella sp. MFBS21 TaxID=3034018 RepID=UPI0023F8DC91|nr:serine hydrolase [Runella sp. MFBS21]MDF7815996.1 serine hydrolase [Runella sp. MFBS21]